MRRRAFFFLAMIVAVVTTLAACNAILGLDERPGASSVNDHDAFDDVTSDGIVGGDGASSSGDSGDDGSSGRKWDCEGPFTIQYPPGSDGGTVRGRVMLSEMIIPETQHQLLSLNLTPTYRSGSRLMFGIKGSAPTQVITFEIAGVAPGTYHLQLLIDKDSNMFYGDDADLGGFYGGVAGGPAVPPFKSVPIVVTASPTPPICIEFNAGPFACLTAWGNGCATDAECRPTVCTCAGNVPKLTRTTNACNPGSKQCGVADGNCASVDCGGPAATEHQSCTRPD